ncbi:MAG: hypothetical protein LBC97_14275 [Bifidobacteriaceae bacterium]|nr:hypothetical protein [Bifidobacteriaceae bacterium]
MLRPDAWSTPTANAANAGAAATTADAVPSARQTPHVERPPSGKQAGSAEQIHCG